MRRRGSFDEFGFRAAFDGLDKPGKLSFGLENVDCRNGVASI
jgi:hypothetical protein